MKDLPEDESTYPPASEKEATPSRIKKFGHLISERWPEYIAEIIVVIIGITISFGISNYQQNAANKKLARIYLQGLRDDIVSDIQSLEEVIQSTDSVIQGGTILIGQTATTSLTQQGLADLVNVVIRRPNFISKNATFSALKNSANFQLIEDIELKSLLFEYDQWYQAVKGMELAELQATVTIAGPYILKTIPLSDSPRSAYWLNKLDVEAILNSVEFMNNVALRIGNRKDLLNSYQELLKIARQIDQSIKKHL
jgi:hypothetical protein